jgi:hypothetical protein
LDNIVAKYSNIDQSAQIEKRVNGLRLSKIDSDAVIERISQLRSDATDAFRSDNRNYGKALREMADALENQIERSFPTSSPLLDAYRAGRAQLAKNNAVRDMLVDKNTGIIDSGKAQKLLEDGVPLTGGLATIAKAGSKMFHASTSPPIKDVGAITWGDIWRAGAASGAGYGIAGGPVGAAIGAIGAPAAGYAARHVIASPSIQRMMTQNMGNAQAPGMFTGAAQRIPLGVYPPLFSQGQQ